MIRNPKIENSLTDAQKKLRNVHGTPDKFAIACFEAVPGFISMDEAIAAVLKYANDWEEAGNHDTKN